MNILQYNEIELSGVRSQYEKVIDRIRQDDFYSAEVKKLVGTPYYRAKLDYSNRLLFKIVSYHGVKYALILEVILNHAYEKSRFLNGVTIDESKMETAIIDNASLEKQAIDSISYVNPKSSRFHLLDKIISLDDIQWEIFSLDLPVIIIGSAGSGKTMLMLEKLKLCMNEVLYVTGSPYLVQNARHLYYSNQYSQEAQNVDFLSYRELLETIKVPEGKEVDFNTFARWLALINRSKDLQDANKLYEEFKGVITGNRIDKRYLSREEYQNLGVKQSIYSVEDRNLVYNFFEKYLSWLPEQGLYDSNLVSFDYLSICHSRYDCIVVDEVQDFTLVQLQLILKTLKCPRQFILCGDSNQIVHPNFFSWSKIKSLFYGQSSDLPADLIRILNKNYRNSSAITALANKILKIKNARFGSVDKESHYLVESHGSTTGEVYCLSNDSELRSELNLKTAKSTHFAVIVLREEQKEEARQYFQTPLIFSIFEAKGLEYDNVILYNLISSEAQKFSDIAKGVTIEDLNQELSYGRVKDKTDRSLEIYKFYINALYVAITRAVQNIYFIETKASHPLFTLLALKPSSTMVPISRQESSVDEWQKEANRLELQGKEAQAKAIRESILKVKSTPWQPLTSSSVEVLKETVLNMDKKDKEARLLLFEYASVYQQPALFALLARIGFAPALKPEKNKDLLLKKYFMSYASNTALIAYGMNFRNLFNQTPLMIACGLGNDLLAKQLLEKGANPHLTDNLGRNAFQIVLQKALLDKKFAKHKLVVLFQLLSPNSLDLQVDDRLVKLDIKQMEFFLVNAMIAIAHQKPLNPNQPWAFVVNDFLVPLSDFPERVVPEKRRHRSYLSSILAKNEFHRESSYNRRLFLRIKYGHYILNPSLKIKVNEEWVNLYQLLNLEAIQKQYARSQEIGIIEESIA